MDNLENSLNKNELKVLKEVFVNNQPLDVVYEDNHIIVIVKPQNVPSQPDSSGDIDALTMVKNYIKEKYNKKGDAFVGLVHRLDRPTGGVMVFAKTSKAASRLSLQIQEGLFEKTYFAVVKGTPKKKKDYLVNYIKKDLRENKASFVPMLEQGAKRAELSYETLQEVNGLSLLKINLKTGRGHQIRLQLSGIGCPIYGDAKYGENSGNLKTTNLALWAGILRFKHPTQDKFMLFKVEPPENSVFKIFHMEKVI